MAIIEINKNPSRKELNCFGVLFLVFFGLVGGLAFWKLQAPNAAYIIWVAASVVTCVYYIFPPVRRLLYLGWMYAAFPIGYTVSFLLMVAIFYLVVTPIGLLLRAMGRDSLCRAFDPDTETYWVERKADPDQERYFRQF